MRCFTRSRRTPSSRTTRDRSSRSRSGRRYQGANPFSDTLCERAIELVGRHLRTAVADGGDVDARTAMSLAATTAGIAFSRAGVHVPHALSYPIASLGHGWTPPGYGGAALVPHGFAVALTAPAVFRFIEDAAPERCSAAARLLDGGTDLATSFERLLGDIGAPMRLREVGFTEDDLPALLAGALEQRRARRLPEAGRRHRARNRVASISLMEDAAFAGAWPSRVAIVGAGTMGIGISHVFALSGVPTVLIDSTAARAEEARVRSLQLVSALERVGTVDHGAARRVEQFTSAAGSIEAGTPAEPS